MGLLSHQSARLTIEKCYKSPGLPETNVKFLKDVSYRRAEISAPVLRKKKAPWLV